MCNLINTHTHTQCTRMTINATLQYNDGAFPTMSRWPYASTIHCGTRQKSHEELHSSSQRSRIKFLTLPSPRRTGCAEGLDAFGLLRAKRVTNLPRWRKEYAKNPAPSSTAAQLLANHIREGYCTYNIFFSLLGDCYERSELSQARGTAPCVAWTRIMCSMLSTLTPATYEQRPHLLRNVHKCNNTAASLPQTEPASLLQTEPKTGRELTPNARMNRTECVSV